MMDALISSAPIICIALTSLIVCDAMLRDAHAPGLDAVGAFVFATALVMGVLGSMLAILGTVTHFYPSPNAACFLGSASVLMFQSRHHPLWCAGKTWLWGLRSWRPDLVTVMLSLAIIMFAGLALTGALAPPTSNEWDTLAYHFAVPKVWLADHRIHMLPYDNHAGFPMLTEMLYSMGLVWGAAPSAKLVHWLYGMLTALTCYWAGRHWVSRKAGLLAAALFLACPVVGWEATTAYIDLAAALYVSLSVFAFARWIEAAPPARTGARSPHPQPLSPGERGAGAATRTGATWNTANTPPSPPSERGGTGEESPHPQPLSPGEKGAADTPPSPPSERGGTGEGSPHPQPVVAAERGAGAATRTGATWNTANTPPSPPSERGGTGWLVLAGICGGLACGVKMTMIATSGLLVLWAAGLAVKRFASWKHVGLLTGLMLVIGGPWYIKTWIWTGNPFYPFAYSLFGGRWWGAAQAAQYAAEQGRFGIGKTFFALWVAPWSTAFQAQYYANPPAVFHGALEPASGSSMFAAVFGTLGIGVIGMLPLWFLARSKGTASRAPAWMAVYGGAFVLVWFALTHQTRYLIPILPILLIPAVAGARAFWHEGKYWRVGIGAFCALAILWGLAPLNALVEDCWGVAWGRESQDSYLTRSEPTYSVCKAVNAQLPETSKILLLNEVRGFYLDRPYQWGDASQNTLIPWDTLRSADEMDKVLKEQGITHVLINWGPAPSPHERWPDLAKEAVSKGVWRETIREKGFAVYAVGP